MSGSDTFTIGDKPSLWRKQLWLTYISLNFDQRTATVACKSEATWAELWSCDWSGLDDLLNHNNVYQLPFVTNKLRKYSWRLPSKVINNSVMTSLWHNSCISSILPKTELLHFTRMLCQIVISYLASNLNQLGLSSFSPILTDNQLLSCTVPNITLEVIIKHKLELSMIKLRKQGRHHRSSHLYQNHNK